MRGAGGGGRRGDGGSSRGGGRLDDDGGAAGAAGGGLGSLETAGDGVGSSAFGQVHLVRAAPGLELGVVGAVVAALAGVASAVSAAGLGSLGVEAVDLSVVGRALLETITAGLGAGVAVTADSLLRLVPEGVATRKAGARDGHDGETVGLGLSSGAGSAGQDGGGGGGLVEHLDGGVACGWM